LGDYYKCFLNMMWNVGYIYGPDELILLELGKIINLPCGLNIDYINYYVPREVFVYGDGQYKLPKVNIYVNHDLKRENFVGNMYQLVQLNLELTSMNKYNLNQFNYKEFPLYQEQFENQYQPSVSNHQMLHSLKNIKLTQSQANKNSQSSSSSLISFHSVIKGMLFYRLIVKNIFREADAYPISEQFCYDDTSGINHFILKMLRQGDDLIYWITFLVYAAYWMIYMTKINLHDQDNSTDYTDVINDDGDEFVDTNYTHVLEGSFTEQIIMDRLKQQRINEIKEILPFPKSQEFDEQLKNTLLCVREELNLPRAEYNFPCEFKTKFSRKECLVLRGPFEWLVTLSHTYYRWSEVDAYYRNDHGKLLHHCTDAALSQIYSGKINTKLVEFINKIKIQIEQFCKEKKAMIVCSTYREVDETIDALLSLNINCHEVSKRTQNQAIPDDDKILVCTQIVHAGINLPNRRCLIDCGHRIINDENEIKVGVPTDKTTMQQVEGRVGRDKSNLTSPDLVIRPGKAGTGPSPMSYPTNTLFSTKIISSHTGIPKLCQFESTKIKLPNKLSLQEIFYFEEYPYLAINKTTCPDLEKQKTILFYLLLHFNGARQDELAKLYYNMLIKRKCPEEYRHLLSLMDRHDIKPCATTNQINQYIAEESNVFTSVTNLSNEQLIGLTKNISYQGDLLTDVKLKDLWYPDSTTSMEQYFTPQILAQQIISDINAIIPLKGRNIYEPCSGKGILSQEISKYEPRQLDMCEFTDINENPNFTNYYVGDIRHVVNSTEIIISNPPFGSEKQSRDYSNELHEHLFAQTTHAIVLFNTIDGARAIKKRFGKRSTAQTVGTYMYELGKEHSHHKHDSYKIPVEVFILWKSPVTTIEDAVPFNKAQNKIILSKINQTESLVQVGKPYVMLGAFLKPKRKRWQKDDNNKQVMTQVIPEKIDKDLGPNFNIMLERIIKDSKDRFKFEQSNLVKKCFNYFPDWSKFNWKQKSQIVNMLRGSLNDIQNIFDDISNHKIMELDPKDLSRNRRYFFEVNESVKQIKVHNILSFKCEFCNQSHDHDHNDMDLNTFRQFYPDSSINLEPFKDHHLVYTHHQNIML